MRRADFFSPNKMEYVLDSGVAIRLVLSGGDESATHRQMQEVNDYLQKNGIIIQRAEIRSKPGEPFQELNGANFISTNVSEDQEDQQNPKTQRDSPLNSMDPQTQRDSPLKSMDPQTRRDSPLNSMDPQTQSDSPLKSMDPQTQSDSPLGSMDPQTRRDSPVNNMDPQTQSDSPLSSMDPQTRRDSPVNNMDTLISHRALKEFNYNDFEHVEVMSNEIKKAYIEPQGRVIIKYIHESDENKYYKKLIREVMNLKDIDQNKNVMRFYGITRGFSPSVSLDYPPDPVEEISDPEDDIYVDSVCPNADYKYNKSSDIYSLGLILWKISSGKIPQKKNKETSVNSTPIDYKELYEGAWNDNSKKRPSIEEVVRSLEDIDINHVYQDSDYIPNVYLGRNNSALKKEACLFIIKGLYQTPYLFLTQNETFIGRIESNHIVIKDQELGKQHAKIKSFQGKVEIFDLGSESGIYVNNKKLEFRASRTLEKDDLIKLGKAVFQYLPAGEYENRVDKLLPICYNTAYLRKSLEIEFKNARENKQNLSLLFFDLDHFGKINKQYSHEAGNYALKELSELIQNKYVRPKDIFARYGGEEFTILLNNTNAMSASETAETIRGFVETHPFIFDKQKFSVTLSIGVSEMDSSVETYPDLLNHAETACRTAKQNGRNRVIIYRHQK
ncbi:GGDEF-domain-containing protein [Rhizophagus irregularis]|uniref:GGDEF-domain-containing protein n=1 Tax=Rhizophagus irregularis TaxID=588596 RepID=A0A2I1HBT9_9GLOM|nr:GGDEF-domain-containing protein [Rhizophagus irregularis]